MNDVEAVSERVVEALRLHRVGRPAEAVALCRRILQLRPDHPVVLDLLARLGDSGDGPAPAEAGAAVPDGRRRRPVWAILPGLLRNLATLSHLLTHLVRYRAQGLIEEIVVSTWIGQVSGQPEIARELDRHGIRWIESAEPKIPAGGHTLHQMKATLMGLEACPADACVLKLRTDKLSFDDEEFAEAVRVMLGQRQDLSIPGGDGFPAVFQEKVTVFSAQLLRMFNLTDMFFFGRRDDLLKLVTFDLRYPEFFSCLWPEQWWFSYPFLDVMRIFQTYFHIYRLVPTHVIEARQLLAEALGNDFFLDVLVSYLLVLRKYFRIGWLEADSPLYRDAAAALAPVTYTDWFFRLGPPYGCVTVADIVTAPIVRNDVWLEPFLAGGLKMDDLGRRIMAARERVSDWAFHAGYDAPRAAGRPDVAALAEILARYAPA